MKTTNEQITKLARQSAARIAAGTVSIEVDAEVLEKMAWELLLLRKRAELKAESIDLETDRLSYSGDPAATRPGTLRAMNR